MPLCKREESWTIVYYYCEFFIYFIFTISTLISFLFFFLVCVCTLLSYSFLIICPDFLTLFQRFLLPSVFMDVLPVVSAEITNRFHQRILASSSPSPDLLSSHRRGVAASASGSPLVAPSHPSPNAADANGAGDLAVSNRSHRGSKEANKTGAAAVSPEISSYLVRLWLLGAEHTDEAGDVGMKAERIEEMVEEIVNFLITCHTPTLSTLLLISQSFSLMNSLRSKRRSQEIKQEAISMRLVHSIVEKFNATPDEILGDITMYILHRYGHLSSANESNLPVQKETAAVLCSTLPRSQVAAFIRQDSVEKQRQLEEIRAIVWGIRLFNKEEGKTVGVGMEDVHPLVETPLAEIERKLSSEIARIQQKVTEMVALLTSPSFPLGDHDFEYLKQEYHHMRQVLHCLLTVRCMHENLHHRIYNVILPKYDEVLQELRDLFRTHKQNMTHTSTASSTSGPEEGGPKKSTDVVPKKLVYPRFVDLADAYQAALSTKENFEEIQQYLDLTLSSERSYETSLPTNIAEEAVRALAPESPIEDPKGLGSQAGRVLERLMREGTRGKLGDFKAYYTTKPPPSRDEGVGKWYPHSLFAFRGFCPVRYAMTGLLIPGKVYSILGERKGSGKRGSFRSTGDKGTNAKSAGGKNNNELETNEFEERDTDEDEEKDLTCPGYIYLTGGSGRFALRKALYFAFASEKDMMMFADDPLRYVLPCMKQCDRKEPCITILLGLLDRLPRELYIEGSRAVVELTKDEVTGPQQKRMSSSSVSLKEEKGTQTGQIDPYVDRNYRWNEWDLRRQALKLCTLMTMRTHGTQTISSHWKRDQSTMCAPPKDVGMQTMTDAATQPPRVVQYIKGLRGSKTSAIEQVKKTFQY